MTTKSYAKMSWTALARIWDRATPNSPERRAILRECRACGYTPNTILGLHGSKSF